MESKKSLLESTKTEAELFENFRKLIQINHLHRKTAYSTGTHSNDPTVMENRDEFYNLVSIIIKPDDTKGLKDFLNNLYDRLDFSFLLSYFSKEHPEELKGLDLESIVKLKEVLDQVI